MKAEELRKLTAPELETKLGELKKELFNPASSTRPTSLTILTRSPRSSMTSHE